MDPNFQFNQIPSSTQITTNIITQSNSIPPTPIVVQSAPSLHVHSNPVQTLQGTIQPQMQGLQSRLEFEIVALLILFLGTLNSGAHQALFSILKGLDLPNIPQTQDSNNVTEQRLVEAQRQLLSKKDMNQSDCLHEEVTGYTSVVQLQPDPINIQVTPQVGLPPIQLPPSQILTTVPTQSMPAFHQQIPIMPQVSQFTRDIHV